jgi:polyribonucleotide nucleotidyltransferase
VGRPLGIEADRSTKAVTVHTIETTFAGRPLRIETGKLAKQAAGSVAVRFGDTMVIAAVTVSSSVSLLPFFPLTVEYREKAYAAGKIPAAFAGYARRTRPDDPPDVSRSRTKSRSS